MADVEWQIIGRVRVNESLSPPNGLHTRDIENATVRVSGATVKGFWKAWKTALTDTNGNFTINTTKSNKPHFIKIEVIFNDDDLEVVFEQGTIEYKDFTVFKSDEKLDGPTINAGILCFESDAELDLGKERGTKTAATWYLVKTAIREIVNKNSEFKFKKRFKIENHQGGGAKGSAIGRKISLGKDSFDAYVILHEMMHIWDYDHNQGTSNWPLAACIGFNTHNHREFRNIAFHEGFAEYAAWDLLYHIWGLAKLQPSTRNSLYNRETQPMKSLDELEHDDDGVIHGLRLVTAIEPGRLHLGDAWNDKPSVVTYVDESTAHHPCPPCHHLMDMWDILTVFLPNEDMGVSDFWNVTKNKNGLIVFLERATKLIPAYTPEAHDAMLMLLNPSAYTQPRTVCKQFCSCKPIISPQILKSVPDNPLDRI